MYVCDEGQGQPLTRVLGASRRLQAHGDACCRDPILQSITFSPRHMELAQLTPRKQRAVPAGARTVLGVEKPQSKSGCSLHEADSVPRHVYGSKLLQIALQSRQKFPSPLHRHGCCRAKARGNTSCLALVLAPLAR